MIDLTPLEVRKKKGDFKRVMRGYEPGVVDDFLDLVADRLEALVRESMTFGDRLRQLEQQLNDYKERERALTDALVSAQELREEMREQSTKEADLARRAAEQEVERIRASAIQHIEMEEQNLRRLRMRQAQFIQSYRTMLERELDEVIVLGDALSFEPGEAGRGGRASTARAPVAGSYAGGGADLPDDEDGAATPTAATTPESVTAPTAHNTGWPPENVR